MDKEKNVSAPVINFRGVFWPKLLPVSSVLYFVSPEKSHNKTV